MDGQEVEEIGKNCMWWHYGFCCNLSVLEEHKKATGETRTFLEKPEDCSCRDWEISFLLSRPEQPGIRPRYRNPSSEIALINKGSQKPNVLPQLEASSYMIAPDPKSSKQDKDRGEG